MQPYLIVLLRLSLQCQCPGLRYLLPRAGWDGRWSGDERTAYLLHQFWL